jgi:hypothetical protein
MLFLIQRSRDALASLVDRRGNNMETEDCHAVIMFVSNILFIYVPLCPIGNLKEKLPGNFMSNRACLTPEADTA